MRPFQVYLDSCDFSVLSDPSKRTQEIIALENQLINWRNAGLIELRFAYPHLIEAAPIGVQYIEEARCRVQKIAELCQGKALAAQDKIFHSEIKRLLGELNESNSVLMDDGDWLPDMSGNIMEFDPAKQIKKSITDMHLNRANTRKVFKQLLTPDGKIRLQGKKFYKESIPKTVAEFCEKYPLDKESVSAFINEYLDENSSQSMSDLLSSSFRNLPNFIEWFSRHYDKVNPTVIWLRESGEATRRGLLENRQAVEGIFATQVRLGISSDKISAEAKINISSIINGLPKTLLPKLAVKYGYSGFPTMDLHVLSEKAPSLFTAISVMGSMARKTLQPLENERSPKVSDLGDVLHSLYLPHVDFFRTDRFAASVIKEIKLPFGTTIVENLLQLPDSISSKLAENRSSRSTL